MDILQQLGVAVVSVMSLGTAIGWYLLRRLRALEAESETNRQRNQEETDRKLESQTREIEVLRHKLGVAEAQAALVPDLQKQVNVVCLELEDMRNRLEKAEQKAEQKHAELEAQRETLAERDARIKALTDENKRIFEANKHLTVQIGAYKQALSLIHTGREDAAPESIPGRPKTDPDLIDVAEELRAADKSADTEAAGEG